MSLKKLNLNRDLIHNCIQEYIGEKGKVDYKKNPKNNQHLFIIETPEQAKALLSIYHNSDGSTTLHAKDGTNPELSERIANHIKDNCSFNDIKAKDFYFKDLKLDEYEVVIEYLVEECQSEITQETQIPHGKQTKIKSKQGDELSFNYYEKKGSLHIQGNPRLLFRDTIEILSELFPDRYKDIIEQQLHFYEIKLTTTEILSELDGEMPNACKKIDNKIKSVISPALALIKIEIELTDYFSFAAPALKGLEGVLKLC